MKRALADVLLLAAAIVVILLLFAVLVIAFQVPNSVGLDRSSLLSYGSVALRSLFKNKTVGAWFAVITTIAFAIAVRSILRMPHRRSQPISQARPGRTGSSSSKPRRLSGIEARSDRFRRVARSLSPRHRIS